MERRKYVERFIVPAAAGAAAFCAIRLIALIPLSILAERAGERLEIFIDSVPFPHHSTSALVKALLTGEKSSLNSDTIQTFRKSGASHILALSGLHLGFIYTILRRLTSILGNNPRTLKLRAALTICFSVFYTLMTGAAPSIVRALFFIIINEVCSLDSERERNGLRVMFLSLLLQLAFSPGAIRTAGFQLSYLAVAGLHLIGTRMQNWFPMPKRFSLMKKIWDTLSISIACQLFTAPLAWHYFHSFPKHFLLTNLLALPLTSTLMALAIPAIAMSASGWCPSLLLTACDLLAEMLQYALETIATM